MTSLLLKLSRNIFILLAITILLFSFSLAYLTSLSLHYFFTTKVGTVLQKNRTTTPSISPFPSPSLRSYEEFEEILGGNLFQLPIGMGIESEESLPEEVKDIELIGVLAGSPRFARALIKIKEEKFANEYAIGDMVAGNKIVQIYPNSIIVLRGNRELEIEVGENTSQAKEKKIKKIQPVSSGLHKITIKRSRVLQLTKNQAQLYENKFAPITKKGKILGLKMIFVPTDNFLYELGVRSGDIIRRINGEPLNNMNRMMQFWQNIQTLNKITVEIERGGKIIPFEILIQD